MMDVDNERIFYSTAHGKKVLFGGLFFRWKTKMDRGSLSGFMDFGENLLNCMESG